MHVKDFAVGKNAPLPVPTVRDHVFAVTGREASILERPVQETVCYRGFSGILTE
jgi:hypothetical protein